MEEESSNDGGGGEEAGGEEAGGEVDPTKLLEKKQEELNLAQEGFNHQIVQHDRKMRGMMKELREGQIQRRDALLGEAAKRVRPPSEFLARQAVAWSPADRAEAINRWVSENEEQLRTNAQFERELRAINKEIGTTVAFLKDPKTMPGLQGRKFAQSQKQVGKFAQSQPHKQAVEPNVEQLQKRNAELREGIKQMKGQSQRMLRTVTKMREGLKKLVDDPNST